MKKIFESPLLTGTGSNSSVQSYVSSGIVQDSSSKEIYVADTIYNWVISYPSGHIIAGGNGRDSTNRQLNYPAGLFYDLFSNNAIIANRNAHNIVQWALGVSDWMLIAGALNGSSGNTSTLLNQPIGVTMDPMGNVYVADAVNCGIQFFSQGQLEGTTIAGVTGVSGTNATLLINPYWVQLDNQLNLYVSDTSPGRIQKFLRY